MVTWITCRCILVYEDISQNKRNTFFLMFMFVLIIMLLGYFLGEMYGNPYYGIAIAGIISFFSIVTSYYHSDKIVLSMTGAKKADRKFYAGLYHAVEGMSIAAGIRQPRVYVMNDGRINAFATGRNPENSAIAVTTGALKKLNKFELEGVIAHEMSHIKNYDILVGSVAAVLVGTIIIMADFISRSMLYGRGGRRSSGKGGGILILFAILAAILAPIVAQVINFAVSRQREYMADAQAVLLTRYPVGLIGALEKIKKDVYKPNEINRGVQHMYLNVPSTLSANAMFSTHPPVDKRIARLKRM